ncbi:MAG: glycosyltransferase [Candidatus Magasanikbacteria bacterium]|nr:glycosyltransferase [Candidatus Magasanikbacteria bacterium]
MKIILSGGGTLGPVVPLLAVREAVVQKYPDTKFIWVGTKNGPEREIVAAAGVPFVIIGAGKWRRYFSFWNILDLFKILIAWFQSLIIIWREKPDLLISAGGFVSVPLHFAGWFFGIPAWVHQQDAALGLANRLMFFSARQITTALRATADLIKNQNVEWLGNPCRNLAITPEELTVARAKFKIPAGSRVIFALGGGTGSASLNKLVLDAVSQWPASWHIIHLTGLERPAELTERAAAVFLNYHVYKFFTTEMASAYALSDVVIARAGFSTLTELAALSKASVILPMFDTHQEQNAQLFARHNGLVMIESGTDTGDKLAKIVENLMQKPLERERLGQKLHALLPQAPAERIVEIFEELTAN